MALAMVSVTMTGCGTGAGTDDSAKAISDRFDYNPDKVTPTDTSQIAVLKGSWYDMGVQLGEQYKDEVIAATAYNVAGQIENWGTYEAAVEATEPYLELADEYFVNEKDGSLRDMIKGLSASTGMSFDDTAMYFISADSDIMPGEEKGDAKGSDKKDCSGTMIWGDATATDEPGCIGSMKADIEYGDLNFVPTLLMMPDNGNTFISTHGVYGSVMNDKGFMIESPGGSSFDSEQTSRIGVFPHMFLAAYCNTVPDAIKVLGDDEKTPKNKWWPYTTDSNMIMGDAEGNACVYEITGGERNIRYNGDDKYIAKTKAGNAMVKNETSDYLCAANLYLGENTYAVSRINPECGLDEVWPDGLARYWSLEKVIQDAVAGGGADADTLRQAMSSFKYYIPEGWDFDAYPEYGYFGTLIPSDLYEKLDSGEAKRSDYYGKVYSEKNWGKPLSKEESRSYEEWAPGWHDNLKKENYTWNLDMTYWSPEENTPDTKTGLVNVFDSNTKTLYLQKGSSNRALSNIPASTGTFATIKFDADGMAERYDGDVARAMLQGMYHELEAQLWFAARDMNTRGVDPNTADGAALYQYYNEAQDLMYKGQSFTNNGYIAGNDSEKMGYYAKAMTAFVKGQCYAKIVQNNPKTLNKDLGKEEPTKK